jgi:hypothetical protein
MNNLKSQKNQKKGQKKEKSLNPPTPLLPAWEHLEKPLQADAESIIVGYGHIEQAKKLIGS